MPLPSHPKRGFTLIELLVVIAIIAIIAGLSVPIISSLSKSGQVDQTLTALSGTLEQARQYAVAQNTYVWVAFLAPDPAIATQMDVAVLASADGTESYTGGLLQVAKVSTFPFTYLGPQGSVTGTSAPTTGTISALGPVAFSVTIPGRPTPAIFTQAVEFTSSGEARVTTGTPVSLIEFDIQSDKGSGVKDTRNGAVFQINGLTGGVVVYRQ
jgi:prepilin-type N-terminal cleavage/methylation domain-containing protein